LAFAVYDAGYHKNGCKKWGCEEENVGVDLVEAGSIIYIFVLWHFPTTECVAKCVIKQ
jgi:hypothetical protein